MRVRSIFGEFADSFGFSPRETRRGYLYCRKPEARVYQFLLLQNSQLGVQAYICSTLFDRWETSTGGTAASTTAQLRYLKLGSGTIEALTYKHSGDEDSVRSALDKVGIDFKSEAEPWFDYYVQQTKPGHLLFEGLAWLDENADRLTHSAWVELEQRTQAVNYSVPHIRHPLFDELKKHLQDAYDRVASTKEERQSMPPMALKLLEYGCQPDDR